MRVLFLQDVNNSKIGSISNVSDGFARNYLFPRGLAVKATKDVEKVAKEKLNSSMRKKILEETEAKNMVDKIGGQIFEISVKSSGTDSKKIFGTVTSKDVAKIIKEKFNIDVDRKKIIIQEKINSFGRFSCLLKLFHNVETTVYLDIIEKFELE
ncbi:MAG: 50S ribosomal protein L9 [Candidatus Improbicoccus pseudotrichonymphae]|uniref:Large ribosomal subunit protein bL9 n=1 Tax=Candidatus Improbicoccus pseudotrichonymphae TaxID=3033792 RepID=A0AA48KWZ5_9FIRM|nr:MAG: 50S ribosomal protein L9 [Candidatus Improbicoccus pseudotrichonymphae]